MSSGVPQEGEIGRRVSIRLHDAEGGFRDLLGILVSTDTVLKKDGTHKKFNPDEIAIWKVVPLETTMRRGR